MRSIRRLFHPHICLNMIPAQTGETPAMLSTAHVTSENRASEITTGMVQPTSVSNALAAGSSMPVGPALIYLVHPGQEAAALLAKPESLDDAKERIKEIVTLPSCVFPVYTKVGNRTVQIMDQAAWDAVEHRSEVWTTSSYPGNQPPEALDSASSGCSTSDEDSSNGEGVNVVTVVVRMLSRLCNLCCLCTRPVFRIDRMTTCFSWKAASHPYRLYQEDSQRSHERNPRCRRHIT